MAHHPDWIDLYEYVRKEIMGYDKSIKLPKYIVLRLQGLTKGQHISNKKHIENAEYDYKTILIAFKFCKPEILAMLEKNKTTYTNEQHKFNAIMCVIDREINNVVIRLRNVKKSEEKIIDIKLENQTHDCAEYKTKSKELNKVSEGLW